MTTSLTRGTVTIDVEKCKGCDLCVVACRPGVLHMSEAPKLNSLGFRFPLLTAGCTACRACYEVCPDMVFEVYHFDTPVDLGSELVEGDSR